MKVLIVDDIQDNRVLLRAMLESRNFSVVEAANGVQALALAQDAPPDLIVSDILMPEMDGFVFCRVVKGIKKLHRIPFIFYTATYLDKEDETLGMAIGAARYIHKPVEPMEFLRSIDEIIAKQKEGGLADPGLPVDNGVKFETMHQERLAQKLDKKVRDVNHLRQQQELILNSTSEGVLGLDLNGDITFVNRAAATMLGYAPTELVGRHSHTILHPTRADGTPLSETGCPICVAMEKGSTSEPVEGLFQHHDISRFPVEYSSSPLIEDGKNKGAVLVFRDITGQKKMAAELLKIRKLESVAVLAGGIAHDFNNILAAILGNISLALTIADPQDEIYELLAESEKASLRAKDLTQQLLTFAKGGEPVRKVAAIEEVIKDSAGFVLRGSNVRCDFKFGEELWPLAIDTGQISQVIQNIIINASQAMPTGGIITIDCSNYSLKSSRVIPLASGNYLKTVIKDQGVGMPAEMLDKIFDPYFTTKQKGSGLGLAITHTIIGKHNGYITADSEPGLGTTFTIYLPASQDQTKLEPKDTEVLPVAGQGRVMIMDDDEMIRSLVTRTLSNIGYEVVEAEDGDAVIQLYRKAQVAGAPIDLVILDLTIPGGMGGKDTVIEIHKINPEAKVIISSGYSNDPVMANFSNYGFCGTIVKPFQVNILKEIVAKIVSS